MSIEKDMTLKEFTSIEATPDPVVFVSTANQEMSYSVFVDRLFKHDTDDMEMMHAALGITGEAGEIADAVKKAVVYCKPIDRVNIVEELGDLRFYMQALMNKLRIHEHEVLQCNANKLAKRYPTGQYSNQDAIARADKVEPALKNPELIAHVSFAHDMEDGWYVIKYTNGDKIQELNNWADVKSELITKNWKAKWIGDIAYKPSDFSLIEYKPAPDFSDID